MQIYEDTNDTTTLSAAKANDAYGTSDALALTAGVGYVAGGVTLIGGATALAIGLAAE